MKDGIRKEEREDAVLVLSTIFEKVELGAEDPSFLAEKQTIDGGREERQVFHFFY